MGRTLPAWRNSGGDEGGAEQYGEDRAYLTASESMEGRGVAEEGAEQYVEERR